MILSTICFVVCHGGPADHFLQFAGALRESGREVVIYATGPAYDKLKDKTPLIHFTPSLEESTRIAQKCASSSAVLTDVGHEFDISMQKALAKEAPHVFRAAYYDNPEPYVPGGYSDVAKKVCAEANKVFFANTNLAKEGDIGIGYYPLALAEKIKQEREGAQTLRREFFDRHGGQKMWVYAGGNNEEYFSKAFPAFLQLLGELSQEKNLSDTVVVLQQHPGAKKESRDAALLEAFEKKYPRAPKIVVSEVSSDQAQVLADAIFYYQTSMSPLFALAGIPILQIGHESFSDILVKNGICPSVTKVDDFKRAIETLESRVDARVVLQALGIRSDWQERIRQAFSHTK